LPQSMVRLFWHSDGDRPWLIDRDFNDFEVPHSFRPPQKRGFAPNFRTRSFGFRLAGPVTPHRIHLTSVDYSDTIPLRHCPLSKEGASPEFRRPEPRLDPANPEPPTSNFY